MKLIGVLLLVIIMLMMSFNNALLSKQIVRSTNSLLRMNKSLKPLSRSNSGVSSNISLKASTTAIDIKSMKSVQHPSFEIVQESFVQEFGVKAILYNHKKTGAQIMSVIAPDENKVFGITFRTPPNDSTGVPHILEHSVLCGSRKFPVKEPFVDLLKGSLQNFLNAFTYPDRTCYPVASTNTKDFYNLVHVYLDAVLHPRAISDPQVLQQEGWHYELEDPSQPLTYKGVVYNEMKGVYSSPDSLLGRATQQALFPDNTYGVDSGGDPLDIPSLTFPQFKSFHQNYYHPTNSRIFFYGNDDPMKRLNLIEEYLNDFDKINVNSKIAIQPKNMKPKKIDVAFPIAPGSEPKHMLTVNWLLNDAALPPKEALALQVLDHLLLGTSSSILRKTLTESQLGESVTGGGLSDELLQSTFGVGLKGVKSENTDRVENLVLSTISKIQKDGFEEDAIKASMNTIEFRLREFNTGSFPRGLSLMLGMVSQWIYDKDPIEGVTFEKALGELKADIAGGKPIFQELLKKYFVENDHRVVVEMKPDFDLEKKVIAEEEGRLMKVKEGMTTQQINEVIEATKKLKEAQLAEDSPEAKATLPRLGLEDIDKKCTELPIEVKRLGSDSPDGVTILTHPVLSNGILYAQVAFDFSGLDDDDLPLLPLFSRMLMESGTAAYDDVALSRKIGAETGGISTSYLTDLKSNHGKIANADDVILYLMISGKAVADKIPVMMDIFNDVLLNARLDNQKRALEMLKESKIRKETSVITSGHTFAATRLAARYSFLGYLAEKTGGITSVRDAGNLIAEVESNWSSVQARLEKIRDKIIRKGSVVVNLTADEKTLDAAMPSVDSFLSKLPERCTDGHNSNNNLLNSWKKKGLKFDANEGFSVPSQVNYVVKGGPMIEGNVHVPGSYSVVSRYLSTGYLWDNVRVLGGAYGGFARFSEATGRFVYMSYRDPNLAVTLDVYDKTAKHLEEAEISDQDLLQAIIGTVGDLDGPLSPDQKGYSSFMQFLSQESAEDRQRWRDEILSCSEKDFKDFAKRLSVVKETGSVVVVGSESALTAANDNLPNDKKLKVERAF